MLPRRLSLALVVPAGLVVLVGVLAYFQYQWLGQVSEAERTRLRATLSQRAREFSDDFDRDLGRAYTTLSVTPEAVAAKSWAAFSGTYDAWKESARFPQVIRNIYAVPSPSSVTVLQFDPGARTFVDAAWPDELAPVRERVATVRHMMPTLPAPRGGGPSTFSFVSFGAPPLFADVPALVKFDAVPLIIELDREYLRQTVLPALIERHFGGDDYRVQVIDPRTPTTPIYSRGLAADARIDAVDADVTAPFFSVRFDTSRGVVASLRPAVPAATAAGAITSGRFSIVIDERAGQTPAMVTDKLKAVETGAKTAVGVMADRLQTVSMVAGAWQLLLQHKAGSLDAAVAQARRRNLSLSFGVLAILAVSVVMVSVTAQRSRRLAAQQMDFVATVSHELRTPLAVIRSAAQNLSAGVVTDATQAKRYGDLIDGEGRRLTDMVEQVLEYAGADRTVRPEEVGPVDVAALVMEAVREAAPLLTDAGVTADVHVAEHLPPVQGDAGALRRALTNLLGNAAKYGRDGQWVGLSVESRGGSRPEIAITVADRGAGIAASDLPHIFDAFYRGQYAKERQIHGNGLGLSLVKRIAVAHGGKVTVKSAPGEGAAFTLHLPAAATAS